MKNFQPLWKACHKKVVRMYEDLALESVENSPNSSEVDMIKIISQIFRSYQPHVSEDDALYWVEREYSNFTSFNIVQAITLGLRKRNPLIPEEGIKEIYEVVKKKFLNREQEHTSFLFFIISKFIEIEQSEAERGEYLIEIARGNIPKTSGFFRRWNQIARYKMAKEK